jgi:G3E family GTPase
LQNKWEQLDERDLDIVLDHLNTLNDLTPKIRCKSRQGVDPNIIFGLDSQLFLHREDATIDHTHNDEVETVTIYKGLSPPEHHHGHSHSHKEHTIPISSYGHVGHQTQDPAPIDHTQFEAALSLLSKETVWRVKGFLRTAPDRVEILNWAFGRYDFTPAPQDVGLAAGDAIKLTVMGERGEVKRSIRKFVQAIEGGASVI